MTQTQKRRLPHTLGQLALALLNATLILIVLALLLVWQISRNAQNAAATLVDAAQVPLARLETIEGELVSIRTQLEALQISEQGAIATAAQPVVAHLNTLEGELRALATRLPATVGAALEDPEQLVVRAVAAGSDKLGEWLMTYTDCRLPETG